MLHERVKLFMKDPHADFVSRTLKKFVRSLMISFNQGNQNFDPWLLLWRPVALENALRVPKFWIKSHVKKIDLVSYCWKMKRRDRRAMRRERRATRNKGRAIRKEDSCFNKSKWPEQPESEALRQRFVIGLFYSCGTLSNLLVFFLKLLGFA